MVREFQLPCKDSWGQQVSLGVWWGFLASHSLVSPRQASNVAWRVGMVCGLGFWA